MDFLKNHHRHHSSSCSNRSISDTDSQLDEFRSREGNLGMEDVLNDVNTKVGPCGVDGGIPPGNGAIKKTRTQILAYLLISSSFSAATRIDDWASNWGEYEFTIKASASEVMSFLAFHGFAISSLMFGYNLYDQSYI
ncbi:hypothetical protein L2E82_39015 [Cichorium intybus]|uniref:Uncharacterized protein n=1 Tax=Cichorium intybus TaxID=13427 RepID=A0ACB9ALE4_CICIN|nr:hypothetical protein L2E82_39015 [Cichorium intybus]